MIHKATPRDPQAGLSTCAVCGEEIKRVPGGQGITWVHTSTGAVAGTTPATIEANIQIFEQDGHWLLISGEMFGPFTDEDQAIDAIPAALRRLA